MLGANVGTTLIVQVLSFDVAEVAPALDPDRRHHVPARHGGARPRDLGRVAIGLGLMLMALQHLLDADHALRGRAEPAHAARRDRHRAVLDVLVAAGLTWAAHSSVAVVLLVMSFAAKGVVPPEAAFALVLGANLGTAINPVLEGVSGDDPAARRLPIGNLINRALSAARSALALLPRIGPLMASQFEPTRRARSPISTPPSI